MSVTIEVFEPRDLGPKSWGRELLIAQTDTYIGKVMWMRAGASGPLQYHERKDETFFLLSGEAIVTGVDGAALREYPMSPGMAFHIPPGVVHRVTAVSDCVFVEASTPVFDDRVNVEARFR